MDTPLTLQLLLTDGLVSGTYYVPTATPALSWQCCSKRAGFYQKNYRILATDINTGETLWDSGVVESDISANIQWGGKPLRSRQQVSWQLAVTGDQGETASAAATFEVTLLCNSDWSAHWIKDPAAIPGYRTPVPYFRQEIELAAPVTKARLYAAARGIFELHINGSVISNDRFVPGWTNFDKQLQFMTYDVTNPLNQGSNVWGALLGDGWYAGFGIYRKKFKRAAELMMQLEVTFADGSTQIFATGKNWLCTHGPICYSDIYDGEHYDAFCELPGWDKTGYDCSQWVPAAIGETGAETAAMLQGKYCQPVRTIEELKPVRILNPRHDVMIWDFGQNITGTVRLKVCSYGNKLFTLRFAEMLNEDGTLYTANYRSAISTDHYIAKETAAGVFEEWEPKFTFHGFRYVQLDGFLSARRKAPDGTFYEPELTAIVLHSELDKRSSFKCSNPKLNQLYSNICWGQRDNFLEVPTDCPQRDERLGWTGDAEVFCPTAALNYNVGAFFRKYCRDMREAQREDGGIAAVAPDILQCSYDAAAWADAAVICPWVIYQHYGDIRILAENYEMMHKWVDYQLATANDFIRPDTAYGDWLSLAEEKTPSHFIGTVYFRHTANLVSKSAALLGKSEDAAKYAKLSSDIAEAFRQKYLAPDGSVSINNQTTCALALHFNMLLPEQIAVNISKLRRLIAENGNKLNTGFVGTACLNLALSEHGASDAAYTLYLQEEFPSWLFSVNQGATTIWERWNSYTIKDGFGDANMNSFNHYAYGAVQEWVFRHVCGIRYLAPGGKHLLFAAETDVRLDFADGTIDTMYGKAESSWKFENDKLFWHISAPANSRMTVQIPEGFREVSGKFPADRSFELPCGTYDLTLEKIS